MAKLTEQELKEYRRMKRLQNYNEGKRANYVVCYRHLAVQYVNFSSAERLAKRVKCGLYRIGYNGRITWELIKDYGA